jgi:hypothetical protein
VAANQAVERIRQRSASGAAAIGNQTNEELDRLAKMFPDQHYVVTGAPVSLEVRVGDGQLATTRVSVRGREIVMSPGQTRLELGHGSELAGQALVVTTIVNDINPATNRLSAAYTLSGGTAPRTYSQQSAAAREGASTVFRLRVEFKAL